MSYSKETTKLLDNDNRNSYSINPSDSYAYSPSNYDGFYDEDIVSYPQHEYDQKDEDEEEDEDGDKKISSIFEPHARKPFIPPSDSAMAYRMRYYNKLSAGAEDPEDKTTLQLPAHVVPSSLFFPSMKSLLFLGGGDDDEPEEEQKQGDIKLIFSIWNTMMGSSLLALPWGFGQSGLAAGLFLVFFVGALCAYTATLIVKHGKDSADFFYLCNDYLGKWGKNFCWLSSVSVLLGGVIAYDILMSDILYSSVASLVNVAKDIADDPNFETANTGSNWWWNNYVTPIIVFIIMFPICNMKNFSIIVTINSLGVFSIMYTVVFIFLQCTIQQGLEFSGVEEANPKLFVLAGLLSISFYIHGMILPIIKSAKNPQNNVRNVVIGYTLVALSYSIVGATGYLAYWYGSVAIPQEFLQIYESYGEETRPGVIIANILLLFQLATVFPLLLLIIRIQVYGLLMNSQYPGKLYVYGLNFALISVGTFFALFFPNFGSILR